MSPKLPALLLEIQDKLGQFFESIFARQWMPIQKNCISTYFKRIKLYQISLSSLTSCYVK